MRPPKDPVHLAVPSRHGCQQTSIGILAQIGRFHPLRTHFELFGKDPLHTLLQIFEKVKMHLLLYPAEYRKILQKRLHGQIGKTAVESAQKLTDQNLLGIGYSPDYTI